MSTHNVCFRVKVRKVWTLYCDRKALSGASYELCIVMVYIMFLLTT